MKISFFLVFAVLFPSILFSFSKQKEDEPTGDSFADSQIISQNNMANEKMQKNNLHQEIADFLEPEATHFLQETDSFSSEIKILSSKEKSSVYINNEYFGTTPLLIKDLTPAVYLLTVENKGKKNTARIEIKRNLFQQYYIELQ